VRLFLSHDGTLKNMIGCYSQFEKVALQMTGLVTCLAWILLRFKISTVLLAESLERKLFACLWPGMIANIPGALCTSSP
jgi:hypothetical protein